ncbi:hypothetical protein HJG60_008558 [Phyllostomus discolor]|uniref:Uncharacterized protein n=1 Tax=Phyllostomus discolor TaxID=89673 RepID=A0A834DL76_9CHIR|nr:hypothetical protein HJG60_008558 [Phyllostomus discolor]
MCLPPSTTVTLNEMQPRPWLQAGRWKLSALPAARRASQRLPAPHAHARPGAVGRLRFSHAGGRTVVCPCAFHAAFLQGRGIRTLLAHWLSSFVKHLSFTHRLNGLFVISLHAGRNSFLILFFDCS